MNGQPDRLEINLRQIRIIHLVMLLTIPLYFVTAEMLAPPTARDVRAIRQGIIVMALLFSGVAVVVRKRMLDSAVDILRLKPDDTPALVRWRAAHIVTFALCESVALFGLVLRFLGATTLEGAPFFAVAFVLMLVFRPVAP
ncbi:MAG TPA: hypothetical protein VNK82_06260 [Terriglobales bacterium]|nr:hypothetical protein [Terriglobales bacterium]